MKIRTAQFHDRANQELQDSHSRTLLDMIGLFTPNRPQQALDTFSDPDAALQYGRAIRAEVVARLPELLEEFERNARAAGATVLWARDAGEANAMVVNLAKERRITYVTKGKSMVTEELGLNDALIKEGIDVFETDLGEFITQLAERPPFHIVGPAINFTAEQICELFIEKGVMKERTVDPVELGGAARVYLRERFSTLEMGITGVNMAIAETGTILNVENEGNIRFCKSSPAIQVSIMTVEKVVPTLKDAMHLVRLLCRFCTKQKITSYVTLDTGPRRGDEIDGPQELIIIIVDNGRSGFYGNPTDREVLRCIRCGACMYNCPVYLKVGGYPYGFAYCGPLGQALNPLLLGTSETGDLFRACTLCGACKVICPGGLDHPRLILSHRANEVEGKGSAGRSIAGKRRPWMEAAFFVLFVWAAQRAWRWVLGVKVVRIFVNRYVREGVIGRMGFLARGWFKSRDLPALPQKTFHERMRDGRRDR